VWQRQRKAGRVQEKVSLGVNHIVSTKNGNLPLKRRKMGGLGALQKLWRGAGRTTFPVYKKKKKKDNHSKKKPKGGWGKEREVIKLRKSRSGVSARRARSGIYKGRKQKRAVGRKNK